MLRDFVTTLSPILIGNTFKEFDLDLTEQSVIITLLEFKIVSPDSFLWRFMIDDDVYYLYAEDFVTGLEDVKAKVERLTNRSPAPALEFVPVKAPKDFEKSGPFTSARVYMEPDNPEEMMQYAADAEFDFAFLLRSDEDAEAAYFNG
jgi:hypothetical protein